MKNVRKDPRWQRKRLKIMERDGWKCVACGASDKELHVHHLMYENEYWDTPDKYLQALCFECHDKLGEHPKAGVGYLPGGEIVFIHCPICGDDRGTNPRCVACCRGLLMVQAIVTHNYNGQLERFEKFPEMLEFFDRARKYIDSSGKECLLDDDTLSLLKRAEEFHRKRSALPAAQPVEMEADF